MPQNDDSKSLVVVVVVVQIQQALSDLTTRLTLDLDFLEEILIFVRSSAGLGVRI
jgi:hypothetical protein